MQDYLLWVFGTVQVRNVGLFFIPLFISWMTVYCNCYLNVLCTVIIAKFNFYKVISCTFSFLLNWSFKHFYFLSMLLNIVLLHLLKNQLQYKEKCGILGYQTGGLDLRRGTPWEWGRSAATTTQDSLRTTMEVVLGHHPILTWKLNLGLYFIILHID